MSDLVTYNVRSGSMHARHQCPHQADAEAVAIAVLERESFSGRAKTLGALLEVSGGQYSGDDAMYFNTVSLLVRIGRMKAEAE